MRKRTSATSLVKLSLFIKVFQIPAYLYIFLLGVIFLVSVFTYAFTIIFFLLDSITLFSSGLITTAAVINAFRNKKLSMLETIVFILLQFVFVADVIATFVLYRRLSARNKEKGV